MTASVASVAASTGLKPETRERAEIGAEFQWDLTSIYPSWVEWETEMDTLRAEVDSFVLLKGTLTDGPAAVLRVYRTFDAIGTRQYRVFRYPQLQLDTDARDQEISGRSQRVRALFAQFSTAAAWFTPELLTVPEETMREWIGATPELAPYRFLILDTYRQQRHVLDESGEKLLSYASRFNETPRSIYTELSTADIKFPTITLGDGESVTLTPSVYQRLLATNLNQVERRAAFEAHIGTYEATKNTYAAIYRGILERGWFLAQARDYPSVLHRALDVNAIQPEVYTTLIEAVRGGTAPLRRYCELRRRMLGLDAYHLYDGSVPLVSDDSVWPYGDARRFVLESVAPLGSEYQSKLRNLLDGGRIDVYENEGKRSGAYSAGVYGAGPFVLLNYNDTQDALFTFAHEMGHAMHTRLAEEAQPFATSNYTIFVAEVASTINERLMLDYLLSRAKNARERFLLLQHAIDSIVGTFYTQVLFADFELRAHQRVESGEPITADVLGEVYDGLLSEYYGDAVVVDPQYRFTWTRIPHFYNSPYYVYQYATSFAASAQLYREMFLGPEPMREEARGRYLDLLRSGGDDHPMKQLNKAKVDLLKPDAVDAVIAEMDSLVTRLEHEAVGLGATFR